MSSRLSPYDADAATDRRRRAFRSGQLPVSVIGLGKMGLPLAAVYADVTGNTVGVDLDAERVAAIERGECPVTGEPGLAELVADTVDRGALGATTDGVEAAHNSAIHVLLVPTTTEESEGADLSAMTAAAQTVARGLDPGDLVVVESTVPPGSCGELLEGLLAEESGLDPATFGVAHCPERTSSGRALRDIRGAYPKVVGGTDPAATAAAATIYGEMTDNDVRTVDARTAECVKLFEGIYRDVNIALANELATFAGDVEADVRRAIEVANTLPMCDIHDPGVGVGGHCIPYYPHFLLSAVQQEGRLLRTARSVNDGMPAWVAGLVRDGLADAGGIDGATVALLGLTYRAGVAETRKSPALDLARQLRADGARVLGVDPLIADGSQLPVEVVPQASLPERELDAAVLVTAHESFATLDWTAFDPMFVVDGRDELDLSGTEHELVTIGCP